MANACLASLQGRSLGYNAFAYGKPETRSDECTLHLARGTVISLPVVVASLRGQSRGDSEQVLAIELVGNRFLRRMIRILTASVLRVCVETQAAGEHSDVAVARLHEILRSKDRRLAARPSPADGLCFVCCGYPEDETSS
uniref:Pseudouridine synthase I TruA alpha/beta domain-containing protein n=2 Tax=Rhizochromulina marina TaxID=1034831 RepID=A0A7S2WM09_9STRA|mmetsp:Transcript_27434/g.80058  ORF Transcript_27434/g.80058 Transcript_27434/m.80058 type:complete len:140 (+) Transcript_27434:218-637(+)